MKELYTRFAPSPTGYMHIGGLRTALFNYFQAIKEHGKFFIRIEDTDIERSNQKYETAIIKSFKWLDIHYEKSIYKQSTRLEIYREYAKKLIKENKAYRCFCSQERLQKIKEEALKNGKPPRYDGHCRYLSSDEIRQRLEKGEKLEGELLIPEERKRIKVVLTNKLRNELKKAIFEIERIVSAPTPPSAQKIKYCKNCAYKEFCWS